MMRAPLSRRRGRPWSSSRQRLAVLAAVTAASVVALVTAGAVTLAGAAVDLGLCHQRAAVGLLHLGRGADGSSDGLEREAVPVDEVVDRGADL